MEIVDLFLEKSKNKFLNSLVKIPKQYDWYLGIVIELNDSDLLRFEPIEDFFTNRCQEIYDKTKGYIQLLNIIQIDSYTLLMFGTDPIPYVGNMKGLIKSICRYLECNLYEVNYIRYLQDMIFDPWGEQRYHYIISNNKAYDLRGLKEG